MYEKPTLGNIKHKPIANNDPTHPVRRQTLSLGECGGISEVPSTSLMIVVLVELEMYTMERVGAVRVRPYWPAFRESRTKTFSVAVN